LKKKADDVIDNEAYAEEISRNWKKIWREK